MLVSVLLSFFCLRFVSYYVLFFTDSSEFRDTSSSSETDDEEDTRILTISMSEASQQDYFMLRISLVCF